MSDERINVEQIQQNVEQAQEQGTFSFVSIAEGREYPRDEITIFMNEKALYDLKIARKNKEDTKKLEAELQKSAYLFKLVGISSEKRDDLRQDSEVKFPIVYEQFKNFQNGTLERREKTNEDRDKYYADLLNASQIEQIIAPNGDVDTAPGIAASTAFRKKAPLGEQIRFQRKLAEMTISSGEFEGQTDATFPGGSSDLG